VEVARKDVWVGVPQSATFFASGQLISDYGTITNVMTVCAGEMIFLSPYIAPDAGVLEYQYQGTGNLFSFSVDGPHLYFRAPFDPNETFTIQYRRKNACGWSTWYTISGITNDCNESPKMENIFKAYPNPTGDILNVEIDAGNITQAKSLNTTITYDVRLFDGQGNLLRQAQTKGGNVEFNVANLPVGIYYLHVYDGVNSKPEIRQIVVER